MRCHAKQTRPYSLSVSEVKNKNYNSYFSENSENKINSDEPFWLQSGKDCVRIKIPGEQKKHINKKLSG